MSYLQMTQISQIDEVARRQRIRNGAACPACGATVRAPMWRVAVARLSLFALAIVVAAASIFGMMRSTTGESVRGQHPRTTYATSCKACGTAVELELA
jgi:hypothetical protein